MARYYDVEADLRFVALDLCEQLRPGTFEHALNHLIDHELDLSHFDARYRNDDTGAQAYPPAMLLKVVLFGYSQGLIGGELFAIDGAKLPSNASKHKNGTRADFERQAGKLEATAQALLARHQTVDGKPAEADDSRRRAEKIERLHRDADELQAWLTANPQDRRGASGNVVMSNRTDNDSAKMATDKVVIPGYTAVAVVDAKHQIVVATAAHGSGSEQSLLVPMVDPTAPWRKDQTLVTADAGYYSKDNLVALDAMNVNALIADNRMRPGNPSSRQALAT